MEATWQWTNISWSEMMKRYKMNCESPIRFSTLQRWFYKNGHSKILRYPRELLSQELVDQIHTLSDIPSHIQVIQGRDAYVTLVGASHDISQGLRDLKLEFDIE